MVQCVMSSSFSVFVEDTPTDIFRVSSWLRQSDPMFSYLFPWSWSVSCIIEESVLKNEVTLYKVHG